VCALGWLLPTNGGQRLKRSSSLVRAGGVSPGGTSDVEEHTPARLTSSRILGLVAARLGMPGAGGVEEDEVGGCRSGPCSAARQALRRQLHVGVMPAAVTISNPRTAVLLQDGGLDLEARQLRDGEYVAVVSAGWGRPL
jgi:hypothetical protein